MGYTSIHVGHLIEIPPSRWVIVTCTTGFSWREGRPGAKLTCWKSLCFNKKILLCPAIGGCWASLVYASGSQFWEFSHPRCRSGGTGPTQQTEKFTKVGHTITHQEHMHCSFKDLCSASNFGWLQTKSSTLVHSHHYLPTAIFLLLVFHHPLTLSL